MLPSRGASPLQPRPNTTHNGFLEKFSKNFRYFALNFSPLSLASHEFGWLATALSTTESRATLKHSNQYILALISAVRSSVSGVYSDGEVRRGKITSWRSISSNSSTSHWNEVRNWCQLRRIVIKDDDRLFKIIQLFN